MQPRRGNFAPLAQVFRLSEVLEHGQLTPAQVQSTPGSEGKDK